MLKKQIISLIVPNIIKFDKKKINLTNWKFD